MTDNVEPKSRGMKFSLASGWGSVLGRFLALIIVFAFFAVLIPNGTFYSARNLEAILRQCCVYATAGLGMTLIIIAAGVDLSAGSMIALSVITVATVLNFEVPTGGDQTEHFAVLHPVLGPILAVIASVLISTLAGLFNGVLVVGLRLIPFIVTLGTMGIFRGLAKGIAKQGLVQPPETWLNTIMEPTLTSRTGHGSILPIGVWMLIAGVMASSFLLGYTRLGRHIFAIGSNEETARLCGVPVGRTKLFVYAAGGFFCGLAGLMQFSFVSGVGQPETAIGYELYVIAAVIIGGASFTGGEGSILGTLIGALLITILYMGGKQMGWPQWVQEVVIGSIIIVAVAIDRLRHLRKV